MSSNFKKSLGQHFLQSERALRKIVEAGQITPEDRVLEIGPGQGALTEKLLATGAKVVAVEKDDRLYEFLREKFKGSDLELIHGDILNCEPTKLGSYKLIANIPYNITGKILEKFLSTDYQPELAVLLLQKEVAKRIAGPKESILSISVKAYGKPRYIEAVKAGSFVPMPKVDSAILQINDISKGFFKDFSEESFFRVLRAGFKSKRKKLSSNLASVFGRETVRKAFKKLELDQNIRAEDVPLPIWGQITANLLV